MSSATSDTLDAKIPTRSLSSNVKWALAGNLVFTACRWGMLALLAKLGSPAVVGRFVLALALAEPLFILCGMHLRLVQATDARREFAFGHYVTVRLLSIVAALLLLAGIVLLAGFGRQAVIVVLSVGVIKTMGSLSDLFYGLFQQRERMDLIGRSFILRGVLGIAAFGLTLWTTGGLVSALFALSLAWLACVAFHDARSASGLDSLSPRWNPALVLRIVRLALPLGFAGLLVSANTNVIRYAVEYWQGESLLGIFGAMAFVSIAGFTLIDAIGQSASARLATHHQCGERSAYRELLARLVLTGAALGAGGVLVAWALGERLLRLLYTAEYAGDPDTFVWLMVAAGISYISTFLGHGVAAQRRYGWLTLAGGAGTVAAILFSILLIPGHGLLGAAWAACATGLTTLAILLGPVARPGAMQPATDA